MVAGRTHNPFSLAPPPSDAALNSVSLEFPYEVLYNATQGFAIANRIGYGSYGTVYKGTLPDGTIVAIKVLQNPKHAGFKEEVRILSKYRHPNLVILMGFARRHDHRLLVYEYLSRGTLYDRLHHPSTSQQQQPTPFLYRNRIDVLRSVSRGLGYLHTREQPAYHRDIKSQNILLNGDDDDAKIADFGLSVLANPFLPDNSVSVTSVSGTPGYICPYYQHTRVISETTEVYAFGMVIMETLTALPPAYYDNNFVIQYNFTMEHTTAQDIWLRVDTTAGWPEFIIGELVNLALNCINADVSKRPSFSHITQVLDKLVEMEDWTIAETARLPPPPEEGAPPSTIGSVADFGADWDGMTMEDLKLPSASPQEAISQPADEDRDEVHAHHEEDEDGRQQKKEEQQEEVLRMYHCSPLLARSVSPSLSTVASLSPSSLDHHEVQAEVQAEAREEEDTRIIIASPPPPVPALPYPDTIAYHHHNDNIVYPRPGRRKGEGGAQKEGPMRDSIRPLNVLRVRMLMDCTIISIATLVGGFLTLGLLGTLKLNVIHREAPDRGYDSLPLTFIRVAVADAVG
ncbi:hypothetical protein FOZ62_012292, partial [Perkinsus olseni]